MALQDYAKLAVFINQAQLRELTSVELSQQSGQQAVELLDVGLAGFTPGPGRASLNIGFVVPIGGLEFDPFTTLVQGAFVDVQVSIGAKTFASRGKIMEANISHSAGASVEGTFSWEGEADILQT